MRRSLLAGLGLCALALLAALIDMQAALTGWLAAFVLVSSLPLGGLCLAMLLRIIPGPWRGELGGPAFATASLLPALPVLALPIIVSMPVIYPWFDSGLAGFKAVYLTPVLFALRLIAVLIGAAALGYFLGATGSYRLATGGLIAFVLADGVLAVDLVATLDPEFHSSGFGLYFLSLQTLTALAAMILLRLPDAVNPGLLGTLLLTALLFWAYFSFMQYFISWSGNLVPSVKWYQARGAGIWAIAEYAVAALRLLPGLLLLFPPVQRSRSRLAALSVATLIGTAIETAWLVLPSVKTGLLVALLAYVLALAGMLLLYPAMRRLPLSRRRTA